MTLQFPVLQGNSLCEATILYCEVALPRAQISEIEATQIRRSMLASEHQGQVNTKYQQHELSTI